jgi:hypothetical protein
MDILKAVYVVDTDVSRDGKLSDYGKRAWGVVRDDTLRAHDKERRRTVRPKRPVQQAQHATRDVSCDECTYRLRRCQYGTRWCRTHRRRA